MSFTFSTPTPRGRHISKKLDVKTFLFSSSNRQTQRCNGQKSRLSKLLSLVQKSYKNIILEIWSNLGRCHCRSFRVPRAMPQNIWLSQWQHFRKVMDWWENLVRTVWCLTLPQCRIIPAIISTIPTQEKRDWKRKIVCMYYPTLVSTSKGAVLGLTSISHSIASLLLKWAYAICYLLFLKDILACMWRSFPQKSCGLNFFGTHILLCENGNRDTTPRGRRRICVELLTILITMWPPDQKF